MLTFALPSTNINVAKLKLLQPQSYKVTKCCLTISRTVHVLNPLDIICWQLEVFSVHPVVGGIHDGRFVIGVMQTQTMANLMDCYQKHIEGI